MAQQPSNNACHNWMKLLKTSKPPFWIEHLPDQINQDNLSDFTRTTINGAWMDPTKMINIDMHLLYMRLADDPKYSILPKLAMSILGCNLSESFVERLFSAASLVLNHKSSSMRLSLVEKLTLLQMNCGFMDKVKKKYPSYCLSKWIWRVKWAKRESRKQWNLLSHCSSIEFSITSI